jgi:metal-dependent amidase/aminoacylase/carboxypeptidase family protein
MHLLNKMNELIKELLPDITDIRQQLHQIPELKFEEFKTAALIANTLNAYGIPAETGIAKTGIVAMIDSGKPGKTVALRADIDALPIHVCIPTPSDHPFRSYPAIDSDFI